MHDAEPATYGGVGWTTRTASHLDDLIAGEIWARCGARSETGPLLHVMLARPTRRMIDGRTANDALLLEWPIPDRLEAQADALAACYHEHGVRVSWAASDAAPINFLFQRDLFFMTPEGAVLARPAPPQRAAEARHAALALTALGVPILATPRGEALFEGADALWLDRRTVLVGVGHRTNQAGAELLRTILGSMQIDVIPVAMTRGVQHLLGVVNFVDRDLAMVRAGRASDTLLALLGEAGIEILWHADVDSAAPAFGMNFVTLAPRRVLMPDGHPAVRDRLLRAGVQVAAVAISEYEKAAGGIGCATGILRRED